ncbi:hypothetical protein BU23DRAFT_566206 [Bimuria novae-zelandiae CBS 107.79]|uniref:F-box domain-containing protein n=1 Tax=Bimuria novae-zelandiae CBS 107.79 TaxID=1447943 RepID=A0A6A5VFS6_9PLEO|nr:hypothetical protein BU23DRAFT_566206 [Bimuria novae-zelandiae CBS 107.79]
MVTTRSGRKSAPAAKPSKSTPAAAKPSRSTAVAETSNSTAFAAPSKSNAAAKPRKSTPAAAKPSKFNAVGKPRKSTVVPKAKPTSQGLTFLQQWLGQGLKEQPVQQENRRRPGSTLFLKLPAETLHSIAAELRLDNDRKALYNLCLTSRVLRNVAQPALFNLFSILRRELEYDKRLGKLVYKPQYHESCVQFTREVLKQDDLAAKVTSIDLNFHCSSNGNLLKLKTADHAVFKQAHTMLFPQAEVWIATVRNRHLFAVLAILLARLRKLRCIILNPPRGSSSDSTDIGVSNGFPYMHGLFATANPSVQDVQDLFLAVEEISIPEERMEYMDITLVHPTIMTCQDILHSSRYLH